MLWLYCKQTSGHISTRILEHIGDTRFKNQEPLIGEHTTKTKYDKITVHIMGSVSSGRPLKYSPSFNHEVGYRGAEGIFASIFPSIFLLNHSACSQCIAPHCTHSTFLALQDLYVGLLPPNLFFLKMMTLLYNETQKNMTWLISKAKIAQYFTLFI